MPTLASADLGPAELTAALGRGACPSDREFDRFMPLELRPVSSEYWTPLQVAMRVAGWLRRYAIESLLDIGSGAGKFCVAAAACAGHCRFIGLEQRQPLVAAARELAQRFGVADRVSFVMGSLELPELPRAQAYYLYNPFGENLVRASDRLDQQAELTEARYARDLARVNALFEAAPASTFIITYNGFGASPPEAYQCLHAERDLPYALELWRR